MHCPLLPYENFLELISVRLKTSQASQHKRISLPTPDLYCFNITSLFLILSSALYKRKRKPFYNLRFLNETTISRFCNCPALLYSVGVVIFVAETTSRSEGELRSPLCTVLSILLNSKVCVMLQKNYAFEIPPFISYPFPGKRQIIAQRLRLHCSVHR